MDAISFLMAGAKAVQVGTATFVDPFTIPKIVKGIERYLSAYKCRGIEEIIGVAG
jgi:dihydroorotate dehydrogenase (NAD+) catalytic subunit